MTGLHGRMHCHQGAMGPCRLSAGPTQMCVSPCTEAKAMCHRAAPRRSGPAPPHSAAPAESAGSEEAPATAPSPSASPWQKKKKKRKVKTRTHRKAAKHVPPAPVSPEQQDDLIVMDTQEPCVEAAYPVKQRHATQIAKAGATAIAESCKDLMPPPPPRGPKVPPASTRLTSSLCAAATTAAVLSEPATKPAKAAIARSDAGTDSATSNPLDALAKAARNQHRHSSAERSAKCTSDAPACHHPTEPADPLQAPQQQSLLQSHVPQAAAAPQPHTTAVLMHDGMQVPTIPDTEMVDVPAASLPMPATEGNNLCCTFVYVHLPVDGARALMPHLTVMTVMSLPVSLDRLLARLSVLLSPRVLTSKNICRLSSDESVAHHPGCKAAS